MYVLNMNKPIASTEKFACKNFGVLTIKNKFKAQDESIKGSYLISNQFNLVFKFKRLAVTRL